MCDFSTSEVQKVVRECVFFCILTHTCAFFEIGTSKMARECGVLRIFTYKCASRHSGMPFFQIGTSKMAPSMWCFAHFDLQMCFAPQRRAIFPDRNFQNGSEHVVFCAHLTSKCASRHSGVPFFISPLNTSAPAALASLLFEHQEPRIIEKTQRFATFLTFSRSWIFFLVTPLAC